MQPRPVSRRIRVCWQTRVPEPIVILGGDRPDQYQVFREHMLLFIEPIKDTKLVKGRYYAFSADRKNIIGPSFIDGALNPIDGVLTVGEPKGGLNRVHAESAETIIYVHTKAAATADMSVRTMDRMDCAKALGEEKELVEAQKSQKSMSK